MRCFGCSPNGPTWRLWNLHRRSNIQADLNNLNWMNLNTVSNPHKTYVYIVFLWSLVWTWTQRSTETFLCKQAATNKQKINFIDRHGHASSRVTLPPSPPSLICHIICEKPVSLNFENFRLLYITQFSCNVFTTTTHWHVDLTLGQIHQDENLRLKFTKFYHYLHWQITWQWL